MDIARVKEGFFDQGHSIVEDAGDAEMLDRLENGARNVWEKVRSGAVDVAGNGPDTGFIFGLLAPEFGAPVFAEQLISAPISGYVKACIGTELRLPATGRGIWPIICTCPSSTSM